MRLDKNNNSGIIFRVAKSNLAGNKVYSIFAFFTVTLAIAFVSTLILYLEAGQTEQRRILDRMQHVIFMGINETQMEEMAADPMTELLLPYKHTGGYEASGIKFHFNYMPAREDGIRTYVPAEGREPEEYGEIVADARFMSALGLECAVGERITLALDGREETFTVCGITKNEYEQTDYALYVSRLFADTSPQMSGIPYDAMVRISDASQMTYSEFEQTLYRMGREYGVTRANINANGKFEESLQDRNAGLYAVILASIVILAAGAVVIYSIFYLSVSARVRQIGQLQTIGMTQKQVKSMVRREGLLLGGAAVVAGCLLGGAVSLLLNPDGFSLAGFAATAAVVSVFGLLTVLLSVGRPAALAAAVSPIEAAGYSAADVGSEGSPKAHKRLTPLRLALMGLSAGRRKWRSMTASLALGGIILMAGASYAVSWDAERYSRQEKFRDAEYDIIYLYDAHGNPQPYGITDLQLRGQLGEELMARLRGIPHVEKVWTEKEVAGNIEFEGAVFLTGIGLAGRDSEFLGLVPEGDNTYAALEESGGLIALHTSFTESLYGVSLQPGDIVTFHWFDGEEHSMELPIIGASPDPLPEGPDGLFLMADATAADLWPGMNTTSSIRVSSEDYHRYEDRTEADIKNILNDYEDVTLHTLREQRIDDSAQIRRLNMQIYGICAFIVMFSVLNLINTLISSISTRTKELAMLESIGMETRQIRRLLVWESFFLALPNLLITFTAGTALGFFVVTALRSAADYMEYAFPAAAAVFYALGMILAPVVISLLCLRAQRRSSLVERIRNAD